MQLVHMAPEMQLVSTSSARAALKCQAMLKSPSGSCNATTGYSTLWASASHLMPLL